MGRQRWFVHLSDIHFKKPNAATDDPYDLDTDLRDQLELDVERVCDDLPEIDGLIISGDVAFAGRAAAEYDVATEWLSKLSSICGSDPSHVWCVPGNHDVDRNVYKNSLNLRNLHGQLRPTDAADVDARLGEALRDAEAASSLFRPLEEYNRFSSRFWCPSKANPLWWESQFELNDGSTLQLRGANSTLVSGPSDDIRTNKLILGTLQATPRERSGTAVVFICHHPLDWLIDYDQVAQPLNARTRVQLYPALLRGAFAGSAFAGPSYHFPRLGRRIFRVVARPAECAIRAALGLYL